MVSEDKIVRLNVTLTGEAANEFLKVKEKLCIHNSTEVIRLIIQTFYRKIEEAKP